MGNSDNSEVQSASDKVATRRESHVREIRLVAPQGEFSFDFVQGMANRWQLAFTSTGQFPRRIRIG